MHAAVSYIYALASDVDVGQPANTDRADANTGLAKLSPDLSHRGPLWIIKAMVVTLVGAFNYSRLERVCFMRILS